MWTDLKISNDMRVLGAWKPRILITRFVIGFGLVSREQSSRQSDSQSGK